MKTIGYETYKMLYARFRSQLKPISTFSDPDGTSPYGNFRPQMVTVWGFNNDDPFIEVHETKESRHADSWDYVCYLHNTQN